MVMEGWSGEVELSWVNVDGSAAVFGLQSVQQEKKTILRVSRPRQLLRFLLEILESVGLSPSLLHQTTR